MRFSKDWDKLDWSIFTTIRKNTGRYKLGNTYIINTPSAKFSAQVIGLYPIKKKEITQHIAMTDADCSSQKLIEMLEQWYGREFDDFVLITLLSES